MVVSLVLGVLAVAVLETTAPQLQQQEPPILAVAVVVLERMEVGVMELVVLAVRV
jgi:hypothetical protein